MPRRRSASRSDRQASWILQRMNKLSRDAESWPRWARAMPLRQADASHPETVSDPEDRKQGAARVGSEEG